MPNFVAYRLNRLGGVGSQKNFGDTGAPPPLDVDVAAPPPISMLLTHLCKIRLFYVEPFEPFERNYGDLAEKLDLSHPALQRHSRSVEPTRIDRLSVNPVSVP